MKISISEKNELIVQEVYTGIILKKGKHHCIGIFMKDDIIELMINKDTWIIKDGKIENIKIQSVARLLSYRGHELPKVNQDILQLYIAGELIAGHILEESLKLLLECTKELKYKESRDARDIIQRSLE